MKSKTLFFSLLCPAILSCSTAHQPSCQVPVSEADETMMKGKFEPTWESLKHYKVPEWYRNAKFGIWAHWGPQCVEGTGDWMARSMYMEGSPVYNYHVEHYGHPSEVGFKDVIPSFKAEHWNPDSLVAFYKKIGAQYFFALGNHHDNFDLWDSKYQSWNSVNMGPKRDVSWDDGMIHRQWAWGDGACLPTREYVTNFYNRTLEVINRYNPDILYFDVTVLPFYPISDAGLKIAAHFYNHNMATHDGKLEAVLNGKILDDEQRKALVWDVERGAPNQIIADKWQTCTCLGGWHYDRSYYDNDRYKSAADVVKLLIDVVSKNGNLLLSVPLRADGTFDDKEEKILMEFGDWMNTNKEAIYDTQPWKVFGEGPIANSDIAINAQGFNEGYYTNATAQEIRFTQKGEALYVTALAWPKDKQVVVKSLSQGNDLYPGKISQVELLGYGTVDFNRTAEGLVINLPDKPLNRIAPVFKVE